MTRYKLKQWYPSLPKDWEIGIEVEKCTIDKRYYVSNQWYKPLISQTEVENNPEFWEKLEEKDYEIIKETYNTLIGKWEIISVKRLSDGEIFSVGDKIKDGVITSIILQPNNIIWLMHDGRANNLKLEDAVKVKEPLLITEDGKDIFEGDTVYVTNIQANFLSNHSVTKDSIFKNSAFKYFAKKENMDRYIEENKPMYSKKDMLNFAEFHCNLQFYSHHRWGIEKDFDVWKLKKGN